ncbi:uncharacterized protein LOC121998119 [Zingiber officinale]|uniref:uncharacterized protein LOC121998119 n=1 Tax=Zingiber officinale TaxID=94328 RepID=UPI001C4ADC14|nr:uncharacterized protein LOC121998119 [Zingiber officinale]
MAEDLQLPSELLDDGFFHGFFVGQEEKRVDEREETSDHSSLDDEDDKVLDLRNEATVKEAELRRLNQYQHRLPNQARNSSPLLVHRQLQAVRILHLKQQQLRQQQLWAERQSKAKGACHSPGVSSSGRAPFLIQHQPLPGSGMTAFFLCNSGGARKESTGTGVFLPRTAGSKPQPQKKSACSTVLIPAKVVQALNLANHHGRGTNPMRSQSHPQPGDFIKTSMSCLPHEWTY